MGGQSTPTFFFLTQPQTMGLPPQKPPPPQCKQEMPQPLRVAAGSRVLTRKVCVLCRLLAGPQPHCSTSCSPVTLEPGEEEGALPAPWVGAQAPRCPPAGVTVPGVWAAWRRRPRRPFPPAAPQCRDSVCRKRPALPPPTPPGLRLGPRSGPVFQTPFCRVRAGSY